MTRVSRCTTYLIHIQLYSGTVTRVSRCTTSFVFFVVAMVFSVLSRVTITINTDISFLKTSIYTYQTSSSHTVCSSQLVNTLRKLYMYIIEVWFDKRIKNIWSFFSQFMKSTCMTVLSHKKWHPLIYLQIMEVWTHKSSLTPSLVFNLRGYHTLQGDNSLKSVERFAHMIFACRFQASRWSKPQREKLLYGLWIYSSESVCWHLLKFWYLLQWIYSNTLPKQ